MRRALDLFTGNEEALRTRYKSDVSPTIISAKLKLVDACNLKCFMCRYWTRKQTGDLNTEEVCNVLDGLAELQCKKVHFTGGEIFMRKDALFLMEYAHTLGIRVTLTTNGTLLNKEKIKRLLRIPARSITLSIDGPHPKIHDTIRGQKHAFKKTLNTLTLLSKHKRPKNKIRINTVVNQHNHTHLPELAYLLKQFSIDSWLLIPMDSWEEKNKLPTLMDIKRYNTIVAPLLEEIVHLENFSPWIYGTTTGDLRSSAQQHYARSYYQKKPCFIPWFHVLVGPKGDVYPCCGTHRLIKPLGNVRKQGIAALFNGDEYQKFRSRMRANRLEQCHHCDDFLSENQALEALREKRT